MATKAGVLIALAERLVGTIAYKLGTKMLVGGHLAQCRQLDCSGFTEGASREVGVSIPHGSQAQMAACRKVSLKFALGPKGRGCFLFISPPPGKTWPRHVGISLGNGLSLECASGGKDPSGKMIKGLGIYRRTNWTSAGKFDKLFRLVE